MKHILVTIMNQICICKGKRSQMKQRYVTLVQCRAMPVRRLFVTCSSAFQADGCYSNSTSQQGGNSSVRMEQPVRKGNLDVKAGRKRRT